MRTHASALLCLASGANAAISFAGVAESGGEFGVWSATATPGTGLPGTFGVDYAFINKSAVDIYVDENGVNLFRIAFLLERMCPPATGLGATFNETHFAFYKEAVDYVTITKGAYAILDPHNYMRYNDPSSQPFSGSVIGNTSDEGAATTEQFGEFWGELASRFKHNEKVMFGLMNEPHDMTTELVLENNQAAINSIRAAGSKNLIIMPGNSWTGGHSWTQGDDASSLTMFKFKDPINNTAIDIHEYLDVDFSGGHSACVSDPVTNLEALTSWLETYQLKAFITEFGGDNNTGCYNMLDELLDYMSNNTVYMGWTAWAAGPIWGVASPCCTDSATWGSLEPGSLASDGSPGLYETVWQATLQAKLPKTLQRNGPALVNPRKHY